MAWYQIEFTSIDPLFFGDSRSTRLGMDHLIRDQDPSPLTLYGAASQYFINQLNIDIPWSGNNPVMGKWLNNINNTEKASPAEITESAGYCLLDSKLREWYPKPMHLRIRSLPGNKNRYKSMNDLITPVSNDGKNSRSSLSGLENNYLLNCPLIKPELNGGEKEDEDNILVSGEILSQILTGKLEQVFNKDDHWCFPQEIWKRENRTGIMMDNNTNLTKEGLLFNRPTRRFKRNTNLPDSCNQGGIRLWYKTLKQVDNLSPSEVTCGGDRRRVMVKAESITGIPLSDIKNKVINTINNSQGFLIYCLTPLIKKSDYPLVSGNKPIAFTTGKPVQISGWDNFHYCPREMLWAYPAGSIFFYEWPSVDLGEKKIIIENYWLKSLYEEYYPTGLNRILTGVWK